VHRSVLKHLDWWAQVGVHLLSEDTCHHGDLIEGVWLELELVQQEERWKRVEARASETGRSQCL
jgi:hypothetical protein